MLYRKFGSTDLRLSSLGYGSMRLPILNGDDSKIDEQEAVKLIRYAIDNGVNYIDTAYPYHKGNSELVVGKALEDGYRDKVFLATKLPVWLVNTNGDFDRYLNEQLEKLRTDRIDGYLLHALNKETWQKTKDLGVLEFLQGALADGRIRYAGFSFHDEIAVFKEIVDSFPWTFCQIQYNFIDENYQAGREGLAYASKKGLAVVVMEPLKGGRLAKNPPEEIKQLWNSAKVERTPAQWALSWVWNHPEVSVVLSGMGSMTEVVENIKTASLTAPDSLSPQELGLIDQVKQRYKVLTKVGCTGCDYCMPCPSGVDIPRNFALYNEAFMYNNRDSSVMVYNTILAESARASACIECGTCEELCPQTLSIRSFLKDAHQALHK